MTNENENGWDSLADELGIEPSQPAPHAEHSAKPKSEPARPAPRRPERDPRPEIEQEADDFGAGVVEERLGSSETIYDPGAGPVDDESEEPGPESYEDVHEGYETPGESESEGEGEEGGKRRRRRRRRRKRAGPKAKRRRPRLNWRKVNPMSKRGKPRLRLKATTMTSLLRLPPWKRN